jgi:hypothetical protein
MKQIFTFILCLWSVSLAAQSFVFYKDGVPLENNVEVTASKATTDEWGGLVIEAGVSLKNTKDESVYIRATQTILEFPMFFKDPDRNIYGFLNFCFEQCYSLNGDTQKEGLIEAGELLTPPDRFHLYYFPQESNYARVKLRYEVTVQDIVGQGDYGVPILEPTDDVATLILIYDYNANSAAINTPNLSENSIIAVQEAKQLTFHYAFAADNLNLEIYNIAGTQVAKHSLNASGAFVLPENLPAGMYVYSVKSNNNRLITSKLIVK